MNLFWILGLVCLSATVVTPQSEFEQKRRFCGKRLADTLSLVCQGVYNSKRNVPRLIEELQNEDYRLENSQDDYVWPYMAPKNVVSMFGNPHHKRFGMGIVDECCNNPCTFSTLQSYCA